MKNKELILSKTYIVWLIAGVSCFLWGSAFPMIKLGYKLFNIVSTDVSSIILFAGIRFFLAGLLTIVIFSIINKQALVPKKSSVRKIAVLSVFQTILQYLFFYLGLAYTTGEKASIINGTTCFFALLISSLLFKMENLTSRKILSCIIGFVGIVIASIDRKTSVAVNLSLGDLFILLSTVSGAFSSVFMKKYTCDERPYLLSGYQFVLGGAVMTVCGLAMGGTLSVSNVKCIIVIVYLALVSAIGYSLWSILLKYNDVSKVTICGFMTPIFGFLLCVLIFRNDVDNLLYNLIGLVLVVIGIVFVNSKDKRLSKS